MEPPAVPSHHPRVYVRADQVDELRERVQSTEFAATWDRVRDAADSTFCDAFVYLITGDADRGRAAIDRTVDRFERGDTTPAHGPHHFDHDLHAGACAYDWCYDLMTDAEKERLVGAFADYCREHAPGYPAGSLTTNTVVGHACEGWLMTGQLPAGVAIYDESTEMYQHAARLFFSEIVPIRNFFYQSHMHNQGTDYAATRCLPEATAAWLFRRLGAGDVFVRDQRYVPYWHLYAYRPDGTFLTQGDDFDPRGTRWNKALLCLLLGSYYDDPFVTGFARRDRLRQEWTAEHWLWELLVGRPEAPVSGREPLPQTKYFDGPMGEMIVRTGWDDKTDTDDAIVQMRIGEYYFGNHQHHDFGTFQIYCRGPLAIDSGHYEPIRYGEDHWRHYLQTTLAHNGLLVFDPTTEAIDYGGQHPDPDPPDPAGYDVNYSPTSFAELRGRGHWGSVTGRARGPGRTRPTINYLAGDITDAYYAAKVDHVERSMVTGRPADDRYPVVVAVYDDVLATDPGFRKSWLLHTMTEPRITDRRVTVTVTGAAVHEGTYDGKLVADTLQPDPANIAAVGGPGKECWNPVTEANHPSEKNPGGEMGAWRVEVSPSDDARRDEFLHVLVAMQSDTPAPPVHGLETERLLGAQTQDLAFYFNRARDPLTSAEVTIPDGPERHVLIADVRPGDWVIAGPNGRERHLVSREEACLIFAGPPGEYRATRQGNIR